MNDGKDVRLSELKIDGVVRDREVRTLGYLTHRAPPLEGVLIFVNSEKFLNTLKLLNRTGRVVAVVAPPSLSGKVDSSLGLVVADEPQDLFWRIHHRMIEDRLYWTDFDTEIGADSQIHPRATIESRNVRIGRRCRIAANVYIGERTVIGYDVHIGPGTVVGGKGFEIKRLGGRFTSIDHAGGVHIEDDVHIHSLVTVDNGLFRNMTTLGRSTMIDGQVHVSHGVVTGKECILAAGCVIAGATILGDRVRIDPLASLGHEIVIHEDAYVSMGATVVGDVEAGRKVTGIFASDHLKALGHWKSISAA
jgi:acyl-[acyl carrier protein]--UDP-N-acetylglucosamine O-acyltransferase